MDEKIVTIKNEDRKVRLCLYEDLSRHGWFDYSIRVYGDGPNDATSGAAYFKVFNFPVSHHHELLDARSWPTSEKKKFYEKVSLDKKEEALQFFDDKIAHYLKELAPNAVCIEHT